MNTVTDPMLALTAEDPAALVALVGQVRGEAEHIIWQYIQMHARDHGTELGFARREGNTYAVTTLCEERAAGHLTALRAYVTSILLFRRHTEA